MRLPPGLCPGPRGGGLQRPQTPSWKMLGYTPIRPIGVNRPAFRGTVPHFHQMSREISRCPAFFENGIIIFSVAD